MRRMQIVLRGQYSVTGDKIRIVSVKINLCIVFRELDCLAGIEEKDISRVFIRAIKTRSLTRTL